MYKRQAQGDDFDPIRVEYTQMLQNQLARGNNGLVKTKYLTFSIEADSIRSAKPIEEAAEAPAFHSETVAVYPGDLSLIHI